MARAARTASAPQRAFFDVLARCGKLIVAIGPQGISANLVGTLRLRRHGLDDLLDVDDGTHHVHVDWSRVKRVEIGASGGEGLITLHDGAEALFRIYRSEGPYPAAVSRLADVALWPPDAGEGAG